MKLERDHIKDAADHLSDLNIFAAVVALLESGLNHSPTFRTAERIVKLAKDEQNRCLRRYDTSRAKAGR
jgi:hypothetical protein